MLRQGKVVDDALLCRRCAPQLREGTPRTLQRGVLEIRGRGHAGVDGEGQGRRGARRCIAPAGENAGDPLERGRNLRHVGRKRVTRRPRGVRRDRPERPRDEGREVARVGGERERALVDGPDGVAGGLVGHRGVPTGPRQAAVVRAWIAVLGAHGAVHALRDFHAAGRVGPGAAWIADRGQAGLSRRAPGVARRVAAGARGAHVLGAREVVARAGVALTDRRPRTARGVGPWAARRTLREEPLAGVATAVERLVPAFAGEAAVVGTRNAIVTRARDARARAAEASIADGAAVAVVARGPVLPGGIATRPRRGIARSGGVALIECGADHGLGAHADRTLTGVGLRAAVGVVAGRAVELGGIAAGARRGVAGAGGVARAGGRGVDGVGAHAGAGLAGVGLRAGVGVVAGRAVGLGGIAAGARRGIAGAGCVALIGGRAHDGVGAHAGAGLAGVALRARVGVVAARAVGLGGIAAGARRGVADPGGVALVGGRAHDGVGAHADAGLAGVALRAGAAVVPGRSVELGGIAAEARRGVAGAGGMALVGGGAHDGVGAHADAGLAGVGLRAGAAVVARRSVELGGTAADTRRGVARARGVALVGGGAYDRVRAHGGAGRAGVGLRAGVAIVAGRPIELRRIRAGARRRVTRSRGVALVGGGAHDRRTYTDAPLTGVGNGAGVPVVAGDPVHG